MRTVQELPASSAVIAYKTMVLWLRDLDVGNLNKLVWLVLGLFIIGGATMAACQAAHLLRPVSLLFLGTDVVYSRYSGKKTPHHDSILGNSDSIIFVRLDPARQKATVVQVPRDTLVTVEGHPNQKINTANRLGGPTLAQETISALLGTKPDYYVVMNVRGVVDFINSLGGVNVQVPKRMHYIDKTASLNIDLQPGNRMLSGVQAMGYVRFRHDGKGDLARIVRQRAFLSGLFQKTRSPDYFARVPDLVYNARRFVYTNMPVPDMLSAAYFLGSIPQKNVQYLSIPGRTAKSGNWLVDRKVVQQFISAKVLQHNSPAVASAPTRKAARTAHRVTPRSASISSTSSYRIRPHAGKTASLAASRMQTIN